jgi:hypothetical protein
MKYTIETNTRNLILEDLKRMEPGTIFARGVGYYPELHTHGNIRWVAKRGQIHDWAIYYHLQEHPDIVKYVYMKKMDYQHTHPNN